MTHLYIESCGVTVAHRIVAAPVAPVHSVPLAIGHCIDRLALRPLRAA